MGAVTKERTCICCRNTLTKGSLLRIVRTPEGEVKFDPTSRANGRGAYVCSVACLDKALKTHRLDQALRTKISNNDYERIQQDIVDALSCENNRDEE
ncbi:MAG: RNase P modulator RnpM [Anaerotardibacter sp.]